MHKIGILTSGGDAPGMNAAIRAVVRTGIFYGMQVYGIERGYYGLINDQMSNLKMRSVSDIIQRGGTMLLTARCDEFLTREGQKKGVDVLAKRGIDGLIVIGGDGSFNGAKALDRLGVRTIGIPATIDNDLPYTDFAIGFDTACDTALDAINKIRDTMNSHERISIIQVMGRGCGALALYSGLCGGAEAIIVPEIPTDYNAICERLMLSRKTGKRSGIVVMAEGAGDANDAAKKIEAYTGFSVRVTVLGHTMRGGNPTMGDRLLGTRFGYHAIQLLREGHSGRIVGIRNNQIFDTEITEGLSEKPRFSTELYNIAAIVSR